jgi:hypothetical protein
VLGIRIQTIKRLEVVEGIPKGRVQTLLDIKSALEGAGREFIGTGDDSPGIRLRSRRLAAARCGWAAMMSALMTTNTARASQSDR